MQNKTVKHIFLQSDLFFLLFCFVTKKALKTEQISTEQR